MKKSSLIVTVVIMFSTCVLAQETSLEKKAAIKEVLMKSYVQGMHINRDAIAVKNGFHKSFSMHVYVNDEIINATLDMWLDRLELDGIKNTNRIEAEFKLIDASENTAIARMEIYENSKHLYTDYFGLYEFSDGWKIVNKIFYSHD